MRKVKVMKFYALLVIASCMCLCACGSPKSLYMDTTLHDAPEAAEKYEIMGNLIKAVETDMESVKSPLEAVARSIVKLLSIAKADASTTDQAATAGEKGMSEKRAALETARDSLRAAREKEAAARRAFGILQYRWGKAYEKFWSAMETDGEIALLSSLSDETVDEEYRTEVNGRLRWQLKFAEKRLRITMRALKKSQSKVNEFKIAQNLTREKCRIAYALLDGSKNSNPCDLGVPRNRRT